MTTVTFESDGSRLLGFQTEGHSGYADAGEDILCAAITSAITLVECAVNDVLGLEAAVKLRQEDAFLSLKLPGGLDEGTDRLCQTLLAALMLYFVKLAEDYPDYIIVLEV